VAQSREDPPLDDLHGDFDLRLVQGRRRLCRHDHGAVALRELLVGGCGTGSYRQGTVTPLSSWSQTTALVTPPKNANAR